jgi:hypothetical protein
MGVFVGVYSFIWKDTHQVYCNSGVVLGSFDLIMQR